ncbi:MAG: 16S rRNA (guanine(966)-N(2))-methyltransferase RsmD [Ignavibacterium sp.]
MNLRIISGKYKGRLIKAPNSKLTRPTTDRVRETLFNILNNEINFTDLFVLDLYAGSGALGLECLSRGASFVHFVEKNYVIYKNLLTNVESLNLTAQCKIFKMEATKFTSSDFGNIYDLILADPPFFHYDIYDVINNIRNKKLLSSDGLLIIERSFQTLEKDFQNFGLEPFKRIGDTVLYQFKF